MKRDASALTWLPAATGFGAALALQDCVLLAVAGLLCVRGFYWSMDGAAPLSPGRAALRCVIAGLTLPVVGAVLGIVAVTALLGGWNPSPQLIEMTPAIVVAIVAMPSLIRLNLGFGTPSLLGIDATALAVFAAVMAVRDAGFAAAACWLLLTSGVAIVCIAWHLAYTVANGFFGQVRF